MKEKRDRELQRAGKITRGSAFVCACVCYGGSVSGQNGEEEEGEGRKRKSFVSE